MTAGLAPKTERPARRTVHLVLPAYNEAESIGSLLGSIRAMMDEHPMGYQVIVATLRLLWVRRRGIAR